VPRLARSGRAPAPSLGSIRARLAWAKWAGWAKDTAMHARVNRQQKIDQIDLIAAVMRWWRWFDHLVMHALHVNPSSLDAYKKRRGPPFLGKT
jgi:hypothetical protein